MLDSLWSIITGDLVSCFSGLDSDLRHLLSHSHKVKATGAEHGLLY